MSRRPAAAAGEGKGRAELLDEGLYLKRSLEDLDSERAAEEIAETDYEQLRDRYSARAKVVAAALAALPAEVASEVAARPGGVARTRRAGKRQRTIVLVAVACFAAAGTVAGLAIAGVTPFARPKASIPASTRIQIELAEASVLVRDGEVGQAISVYYDVLKLDPRQPEALANSGWLLRAAGRASGNAGLVADGDADIALAARVDPSYELARAYYAVVLYVDEHNAAGSVTELTALAEDKPPSSLVKLVQPTAKAAYKAVGKPLPRALEPDEE